LNLSIKNFGQAQACGSQSVPAELFSYFAIMKRIQELEIAKGETK